MNERPKERRTRWIPVIAPMLRGHMRPLVGAGGALTLDAWLTALRPWPLKVVVDRVVSDTHSRVPFLEGWVNDPQIAPHTLLAVACGATLILALGTGITTYAYTYLMGVVSQELLFQLRSRVFSHLQYSSLQFHDRARVGDLMLRLTSDISAIRMLLGRGLMLFASNAVLVLAMLVMMFWLNWRFALVACSVAPALFAAVYWSTSRIKQESTRARESDGDLAAMAAESLSMIRTVKGLGQERRHVDRYSRQNRTSLRHYLARLRHQARMAPLVDILAAAGLALVMWFGAVGVVEGSMSTGDVIVFFSYVTGFYSPMRAMSRQASVFSKAAVGVERVAEVLASEHPSEDARGKVPAPPLRGGVVFEDVTFAYEDGPPVLERVSLEVRPGERVGVVGASGAGKSTLIALLLGLYQPQEGRILLDGIDVRTLRVDSLRRQIGLVLQDPMLMRGSVESNVGLGHDDAGPEDVERACRTAQALDFVREMGGIEAQVEEQGKNLSGGQRQRLAIARAIVRDAPILLLDEPTSSLDAGAERAVVASLDAASRGRTTLLITHSEAALRLADRVLALEGGRLVDAPERRRPARRAT